MADQYNSYELYEMNLWKIFKITDFTQKFTRISIHIQLIDICEQFDTIFERWWSNINDGILRFY